MTLGKGGGTEVCYNVQTAVDAKYTLILACEVTNDTSERLAQPNGPAGQSRAREPL